MAVQKRTASRGKYRGKQCQFIGAWFPVDLVDLIDLVVERDDTDRSKVLRVALEEKLRRRSAALAE
jgi:metal-responsive CopG/Arc/MetJ family transcriptional regulator